MKAVDGGGVWKVGVCIVYMVVSFLGRGPQWKEQRVDGFEGGELELSAALPRLPSKG